MKLFNRLFFVVVVVVVLKVFVVLKATSASVECS